MYKFNSTLQSSKYKFSKSKEENAKQKHLNPVYEELSKITLCKEILAQFETFLIKEYKNYLLT